MQQSSIYTIKYASEHWSMVEIVSNSAHVRKSCVRYASIMDQLGCTEIQQDEFGVRHICSLDHRHGHGCGAVHKPTPQLPINMGKRRSCVICRDCYFLRHLSDGHCPKRWGIPPPIFDKSHCVCFVTEGHFVQVADHCPQLKPDHSPEYQSQH